MAMIHLEDFHKAGDGDDWLPAFYRAQAALSGGRTGYSYNGGFTLQFHARAYYFSDTAHITSPISLIGSGAATHNGTVLMFPKGKGGLVLHGSRSRRFAKYGNPPPPALPLDQDFSLSQGSCIEKLQLLAVDPVTRAPAETHVMTDYRESAGWPNQGAHGITLLTQAAVRDVTVTYFDGHGVYIYGNGDDDPLSVEPGVPLLPGQISHVSTIAAFCQLTNVYVSTNGGDGLHIYGRDASGTQVHSCQFIHNGGWGICDLSYLGQSVIMGGQTAYNLTGGVCRPYGVLARTYHDYAALMGSDLSYDPAGAMAPYYRLLIAAIPGAIVAAGPVPAPDPALGTIPVQSGAPGIFTLVAANLAHRQAWEAYHTLIGGALQAALIDAGLSASYNLTHLDFRNPYTAGSDIIIGLYSESNGDPALTDTNVMGGVNFTIASLVQHKTDALGWSAAGFRHTLHGWGGIGLEVEDSPILPDGRPARWISYFNAKPGGRPGEFGAVALNAAPQPGGHVGWVNVETPDGAGEWRPFGQIS